jgi:deoxycytidine triphosphate deaminase
MLRAEEIANLLQNIENLDDTLTITPEPDIKQLSQNGSASIDLRLGCWFTSLHKSSVASLPADSRNAINICDDAYIPFGSSYVLHPRDFVLAVTLEWVSIPLFLAGYIHGKSSWGRRGLIIATASVIHPGFKGCITLELTNLGEVPISIKPGMRISQLCLHEAPVKGTNCADQSSYIGKRKPTIGNVKYDTVAECLMRPIRIEDEKYTQH